MMDESFLSGLNGFLEQHEDPNAPQLFAEGDSVGEWRVTGFLGRGGNAEVYRVVHTDGTAGRARSPSAPQPQQGEAIANELVAALKVIVRSDDASKKRFHQEVALLSSQMGTHFAKYYSSGEIGGRLYLVIELLEPVDLPESEKEIADYLLAVCRAVGVLHKSGLVHRDIKPSNIMRRATGELVLIDLGLVKDTIRSFDPERDVSIVSGRAIAVGTPRFAAPEQMSGGEVTAATDIHAIGRLADVAFHSSPPRCWTPIIRRATSSIPGQRYSSVEDLSRAIRSRHRMRRMTITMSVLAVGLLVIVSWGRRMMETVRWQMLQSVSDNKVQIQLPSEDVAFSYPLELEGGREYFVQGPGKLLADMRAATPVRVHLKNCFLFNSSTVSVDKANIRYVFQGGGYLNFTALDEPPRSVLNSQIENFDLFYDEICFKGPMTSQGLERLRRERIQRPGVYPFFERRSESRPDK